MPASELERAAAAGAPAFLDVVPPGAPTAALAVPLRVLLLVENNAYPADFRVRREALALRSAGHRVTVIAPRDTGQRWRESVDGIEVLRFPAPPSGRGLFSYAIEFGYASLAMLAMATWVAATRGVDVVHAANPPDTLWIVGAALKLAGVRFVFDQHDLSPELYQARFSRPVENGAYRGLRRLERWSYACADVVITANESYRQVAIARGGKAAERVFVVRNGPPLAYRPTAPDPALAARARHLVGYIGTIGPQDGLDVLVRAVRHLASIRQDFLVLVIGDGDALASVRDLARSLEVEPYMEFTGRLPEAAARPLLSTVEVCVQPDPSNALNDVSTMNKLMEYMALGKPTVAFDLKETRFSAQDAALYARPNDEIEFAQRVSWLFDHPEAGRTMGELGRRRVEESLAWEHSTPHLLAAYAAAMSPRPRR